MAYANVQIAMDAPFGGRVADEKVRKKSDNLLQETLNNILEVAQTIKTKIVVVQVAEPMIDEVIKHVFNKFVNGW